MFRVEIIPPPRLPLLRTRASSTISIGKRTVPTLPLSKNTKTALWISITQTLPNAPRAPKDTNTLPPTRLPQPLSLSLTGCVTTRSCPPARFQPPFSWPGCCLARLASEIFQVYCLYFAASSVAEREVSDFLSTNVKGTYTFRLYPGFFHFGENFEIFYFSHLTRLLYHNPSVRQYIFMVPRKFFFSKKRAPL